MIPTGKVLFRAKKKGSKEWVYGIPLYDWAPCSLHCPNQHNGKLLGFMAWIDPLHEYDEVEVDPETVCMYVWAEDKDGKPIYTGDIMERAYNHIVLVNGRPQIQVEFFRGTVKWAELPSISSGRWVLEGTDKNTGKPIQVPLSVRGNNTCTIMGSIYD